ncbi:hypothetical protein GE09DRAFT_314072 [Coniochaeta sp. 2T2.1]|nr:hypothetical protein GE09DRAFT_314072 [Coniochaeta sp. 2T2.1]
MPAQTFSEFWSAQHRDLPLPAPSAIAGRLYVLTGGNHGIGLEAAKHLVRMSASRVIISSRSLANGAAAVAEIERDTGITGKVEAWQLDLGNFDSVKQFAKKVEGLERVDAVIENASIATDFWTVREGIETSVAVNIVGTFLLGVLVYSKLVESGKKFGTKTSLTVVGSNAAFFSVGVLEKVEGDILQAYNTKGKVDIGGRYEHTKLIQFYILRELATQLPYEKAGVVINCISPGLCNTGLARNASLKTRFHVRAMNILLGRTAEMGSRTLLHAATVGPESHGKYVADCQVSDHYVPEWVTDESGRNIQKRLWKELSGMLNDIEPGCLIRALSKAR